MQFRTQLSVTPAEHPITHHDSLLLLGSCFTTSVGQKLIADGFDAMINPFGQLYNPASVALLIERIVESRPFTADDAIHHEQMYHSFLSHTSMSRPELRDFLDIHNTRLSEAHRFMSHCTTAIITLGTSWIYTLSQTGQVVANCHKMHPSTFRRTLLTADQSADYLDQIVADMRRLNPQTRIIFTVSPIRHLADGLHGNMLSKASLIVAIERAISQHPDCHYFPSFEIMLDDLRDYRFYQADMLHPSDTAVDYIYQKFSQHYFTPQTIEIAAQFNKLYRRTLHRPINQSPDEALAAHSATITMANTLAQKYPCLKKSLSKCRIN